MHASSFYIANICNIFLHKIKLLIVGKPAIGVPWSLIDLDGHLVTEQDFAAKW